MSDMRLGSVGEDSKYAGDERYDSNPAKPSSVSGSSRSLRKKVMNDRLVLEKELFYCEMAVKSLQKEVRKLRKEKTGDRNVFRETAMHSKLHGSSAAGMSGRNRKNKGDGRFHGTPGLDGTAMASRRTHFAQRRSLQGHFGKVYALNWSAREESTLASSSQDGNLIIWDAHRQVKRLGIPLKSSWVMACQLSPMDTYVACGGLDNKVTVYDVVDSEGWSERKPYKELSYHGSYVSCIRFVDESRVLSSSGDMTCLRWDLVKGIPDRHFLDHTGDVMAVAVPPLRRVGSQVVSSSEGPLGAHVGFASVSCDNTAKIWDFRAPECVGNFEGHTEDVNAVDFFPDGNAFFTGSDDGSVKLFDIRAYRCLNTYRLGGPIAQGLSVESSVAGGLTGRSTSSASMMSGIGEPPGVTSVRSSKSGSYLFAAYDQSPHLCSWLTVESAVCQDFGSLFTRVSSLDLNCSGRAIATGSWDFLVTVWS